MSIKRTLAQTANGKYVVVDTANVPEPLRINTPYETMVFKSNKKGELKDTAHPLCTAFASNVQSALTVHQTTVELYQKEILT